MDAKRYRTSRNIYESASNYFGFKNYAAITMIEEENIYGTN